MKDLRLRVVVALALAAAAVALYLPAEARASAFHDFHRHLTHPWGNAIHTILILASCAGSLAAAMPVLRRGSAFERTVVVVALSVPLLIAVHFLGWVARQWGA